MNNTMQLLDLIIVMLFFMYSVFAAFCGAVVCIGIHRSMMKLKADFACIELLIKLADTPLPRWRYRLLKPTCGVCLNCMASAWGVITFFCFLFPGYHFMGVDWYAALGLPIHVLLVAGFLAMHEDGKCSKSQ